MDSALLWQIYLKWIRINEILSDFSWSEIQSLHILNWYSAMITKHKDLEKQKSQKKNIEVNCLLRILKYSQTHYMPWKDCTKYKQKKNK